MWQAALQDPAERQAFTNLVVDYFARPPPTSGSARPGPRHSAPLSSRSPAPVAAPRTAKPRSPPPATASSYAAPSPRHQPASPAPQDGPKRPAGLVQEQKVAGGFDASSKRALAKALLSSNGPMSREEERKKKEAGPGPLAVAVPRTYNGAPPPRRGAAAAVPSTEERVRALYDYVGTTAEDLSVREGEELVVVERVDADWTRCKSSAGAVGLVPSTYVQSL